MQFGLNDAIIMRINACSKNIFQILANGGIEDWEQEFLKKTFGEKKIILQFPTLDFYHKAIFVIFQNQTGYYIIFIIKVVIYYYLFIHCQKCLSNVDHVL